MVRGSVRRRRCRASRLAVHADVDQQVGELGAGELAALIAVEDLRRALSSAYWNCRWPLEGQETDRERIYRITRKTAFARMPFCFGISAAREDGVLELLGGPAGDRIG
jgi:hypothetical protein